MVNQQILLNCLGATFLKLINVDVIIHCIIHEKYNERKSVLLLLVRNANMISSMISMDTLLDFVIQLYQIYMTIVSCQQIFQWYIFKTFILNRVTNYEFRKIISFSNLQNIL